ncbi:bis(5'-nucleosyl)-tetraphosphatase (symmetrical) YqeK [Salimicrobium halophilum]|uniref:bis(5'-nucleosyl)-tetraphosphatase (symmetrical) n=1 Tax=Salimicrobium halophilum TaxID=86666 RepID=A0A1G8PNQ9_9BACI|nr:bis(5'-nucleosyl)-tetraphosphatase (symmetrical) YqeK [Salimicrobium halophilum]SDI94107.1 putative HD superfamily hydrolase of NAD metabolism [Salimicrobium halophilum]
MDTSREELKRFVRPHLTEERFDHTVRVTDTAHELAERFGGDARNIEVAGMLHDYAKYRPEEEMCRWIEGSVDLPKDLLNYSPVLWHGPVGVKMLEKEWGPLDRSVQAAIASHTTGNAIMSIYDKILFLADYIEPGRDFPGVEKARRLSEEDLDKACLYALDNTIRFLMSKNQTIYPDTFHAYNSLQKKQEEENG